MLFLSTCALVAVVLVSASFAERISNVDSPSWSRRTTDSPYGFNSGSGSGAGGRSPTFDGDAESVRPYGSSDSWTTDNPRRFTHTWDRASDDGPTRSSYLDRFTTQGRYGSAGSGDYDRDSQSAYGSYGGGSSRRPSYATDRWGDPVGGEVTTPRSPYGSYSTSRWGSAGEDGSSAWGSGSRTTSRYGSSADRESVYSSGSRTTSRYGSSGDRESVYSSGSASGGARDSFDRNSAYLRIEAELVKLTNDQGLTSAGSKCDTFGACDTMCYGYLDTERPNAEFPGARDIKHFKKLFETDDNNSPAFSKANVTRDVCGVPYRETTFRVYCEDRDTINTNDLINQWDCNIQRDPEGETFATWHAGVCNPKFQQGKMTLTFRYKIYTIGRTRCDSSSGAMDGSTTTTRRRS